MSRHYERVLFTGGRSPATLALLRLFAARGARCFVAESITPNLAGASRFCQKNLRVPPPNQDPEAYIAALEKYIQAYKIELLVPTCEEVFFISRWKHQLEKQCTVFTSSIDILTHLHSKYQFIQLLKALKLSAPETVKVETKSQLEAALAEFPSYVLKPEFSRFSNFVMINQAPETCLAKISPTAEIPWVVQAFLEGPQYCSYSVARAGKLLAHSVYASTYCAGLGSTIYFESAGIPAILRIVEKIVAALDYTGQIAFDFIHAEGRYWPIECNPRATTGTLLFTVDDDLPAAFSPDYPGPVIHPSGEKNSMVTLAMYLYALPQLKSLSEFRTWWAKMGMAEDAIFHWDDLQPFIKQFQIMWKTWLLAKKHQVTLLEASTLDIEWNGHWPARSKQ
ncbi:hypothetical protein COW36_01905 [bacterium (Candidatus Blackallbacteria) CG17_big_fil_post_rev_8_21_14_2_50_48_46]|uniref:ATP-grasp fold PylC-type domain-containing protein n=1 Tax=bacterium (Candidatus Blackallbacteria) CG17_big_fil_post_rev_8_21_14_2_50_48_46 TaxID=2014261 RepID=A0A2M7GAL2_9BACT|nr:MAG: hypothetical protein COW64_26295 [bacterium (Candidatus Blackallbacteria) CG18_big_fil_WC_8_21_14_2_50_49_26]PIW19190.1 MAG: hypothetical protein COW36_01905 [bacterium (Candidatus Blackallbacteria) CG17_big_fil_post_rev_8_21_14_2_50_48_46]PIW45460.1 MAG: hypothetical protein COW20_20235 [bacterium (Candidatus Blackallbacteria) CG13_big_fil_rev_8_21_14_2_50_49_14]